MKLEVNKELHFFYFNNFMINFHYLIPLRFLTLPEILNLISYLLNTFLRAGQMALW